MKKIKTLSFIIFAIGILSNSTVFANESKIILFYTGWHAKTREAKALCTQLSRSLGIKFQEYNVDRLQVQKYTENVDFKIPSAIPYIYVQDHRGKIVYKKLYKSSSAGQIRNKINKLFGNG